MKLLRPYTVYRGAYNKRRSSSISGNGFFIQRIFAFSEKKNPENPQILMQPISMIKTFLDEKMLPIYEHILGSRNLYK